MPDAPPEPARPGPPPRPRAQPPRAQPPRRQTALLLISVLAVLTAVLLLVFVLRLSQQPGAKVKVGAQEFNVGRDSAFAPTVTQYGPLIFPPLRGDLTLYVQHLGAKVDKGWLAFDAHDPGQPANCLVQWQARAKHFVDPCDQAVFPANGAGLIQYGVQVDKSGDVIVDLRQPLPAATTTAATTATTVAGTTSAPSTTTASAATGA